MTIEVIFGADYEAGFAVMELLPAADTCDVEAVTLVPATLNLTSAADSCAIVVGNGLLVSLDLQPQPDTGSIDVVPNPAPIPQPVSVFPQTNDFTVLVSERDFTVIVPEEDFTVVAD